MGRHRDLRPDAFREMGQAAPGAAWLFLGAMRAWIWAMASTFCPLTSADLTLLATWLRAPHVARWWDGADSLGEIAGHLSDPDVDQVLVWHRDGPLAYLQDYRVHSFKAPPLAHLPKGARGLETFIGAQADLHQGHGADFLAQYIAEGFARGVPAFGIDSDPSNHAAIRTYQKACFQAHTETQTPWGPALLMEVRPVLSDQLASLDADIRD